MSYIVWRHLWTTPNQIQVKLKVFFTSSLILKCIIFNNFADFADNANCTFNKNRRHLSFHFSAFHTKTHKIGDCMVAFLKLLFGNATLGENVNTAESSYLTKPTKRLIRYILKPSQYNLNRIASIGLGTYLCS